MSVNNKLAEVLKKIYSMTEPFIDLLKDSIGNQEFYQLLNCSFLSDDAAILITSFEIVGALFINVSACLAAAGFINWIILIFGVIYSFRKTSRDNFLLFNGNKGYINNNKYENNLYQKVDINTNLEQKIDKQSY